MVESELSSSGRVKDVKVSLIELDELRALGMQLFDEISVLKTNLKDQCELNARQKSLIEELKVELETQKQMVLELSTKIASDQSFELLSHSSKDLEKGEPSEEKEKEMSSENAKSKESAQKESLDEDSDDAPPSSEPLADNLA